MEGRLVYTIMLQDDCIEFLFSLFKTFSDLTKRLSSIKIGF
jgi:hypothetical protein